MYKPTPAKGVTVANPPLKIVAVDVGMVTQEKNKKHMKAQQSPDHLLSLLEIQPDQMLH